MAKETVCLSVISLSLQGKCHDAPETTTSAHEQYARTESSEARDVPHGEVAAEVGHDGTDSATGAGESHGWTKGGTMSITGWYYLHANGDVLYKRDLDGIVADFRESDFVRMFWPVDPTDRSGAWRILVEATALGARPERIRKLQEKWGCTDADAQHYATHIDVRLFMDGSAWCATRADFENPQEDPAGFGPTCLEALSALCNELGFTPSKMWGASFHDLVKVEA